MGFGGFLRVFECFLRVFWWVLVVWFGKMGQFERFAFSWFCFCGISRLSGNL